MRQLQLLQLSLSCTSPATYCSQPGVAPSRVIHTLHYSRCMGSCQLQLQHTPLPWDTHTPHTPHTGCLRHASKHSKNCSSDHPPPCQARALQPCRQEPTVRAEGQAGEQQSVAPFCVYVSAPVSGPAVPVLPPAVLPLPAPVPCTSAAHCAHMPHWAQPRPAAHTQQQQQQHHNHKAAP